MGNTPGKGSKAIGSILAFLLVLLYLGARVGGHFSQIRQAQKKPYYPKVAVNLPEDVIFASTYVTEQGCASDQRVRLSLTFTPPPAGFINIQSENFAHAEQDTCQYRNGAKYQFKGDSIRLSLSLGVTRNEAICPLDCRLSPDLYRRYFLPQYRDTLIQGQTKRILLIPGYEAVFTPA